MKIHSFVATAIVLGSAALVTETAGQSYPQRPVRVLVGLIVYAQYYLSVSNAVPATSVKELIALAKTRTPRLSYASSGIGSANHLSGELFRTMAGIEMVHVPYKGGAPHSVR